MLSSRLRLWVLIVIAGLVGSVGALAPSCPAHACSCRDLNPRTKVAEATYVIAATVEESKEDGDYQRLTFRVTTIFKGDLTDERIVVRTHSATTACGLGRVPVGYRMILFLKPAQNGVFRSNWCEGSNPDIPSVREEVEQILGKGRQVGPTEEPSPTTAPTPTLPRSPEPKRVGALGAVLISLLLAALIGGIVTVAVRQRGSIPPRPGPRR